MNNFKFHASTEILFGDGQVNQLNHVMNRYGKNVLLTYGSGSIKRNGLYQAVLDQLKGFNVIECPDIEPNPRIESVRRGVELCRQHQIDVILAVGGGSVLDCSKVIAAGVSYEGDPWDLVLDSSLIKDALPLVTILTMAATGSEMNRGAVISNMETNQKLGTGADSTIPQVSILDPVYSFTLPAYQTAAGIVDITSHLIENYFKVTTSAYVQDRISEGVFKSVIHYARLALQQPDNYEARANIMWASTMALNGLTGAGKAGRWSCHAIEHELSAHYDITHGVGLAIVTPRWMRHILREETVEKFCDFARNVWGLPDQHDRYALAIAGIEHLEQFYHSLNIPMTLNEVGIDDQKIDQMAEAAVKVGSLQESYVALDVADVKAILTACL